MCISCVPCSLAVTLQQKVQEVSHLTEVRMRELQERSFQLVCEGGMTWGPVVHYNVYVFYSSLYVVTPFGPWGTHVALRTQGGTFGPLRPRGLHMIWPLRTQEGIYGPLGPRGAYMAP